MQIRILLNNFSSYRNIHQKLVFQTNKPTLMNLLDRDVHIPDRPMLQMGTLLPHHVIIITMRDGKRVG